jgi:soluble lytic murein transglycosylase
MLLRAAERAFEYGEWTQAVSLAQALEPLLPPPLAESARLLEARSDLALGEAQEAINLLEGADFADTDIQAKVIYLLASAYRDEGDWLKAIEKQTALLSTTAVLTGWMHELNGDARVQLGETAEAVASYRLAGSAVQGSDRLRLLEKIAQVQVKAQQGDDALKTYEEILAQSTSPELSAKVHYLMGTTFRDQGRDDAALQEFLNATEASTVARESYLALVELVNSDKPVDAFRRGLIDYQNGAHLAAVQAFESYIGGAKPEREADAWYYSGLSQLALGQYEDALDALDASFASTSDASFQAKVLMAQARVLRQADRLTESRATYARVLTICPECDAAPQALWLSAEAAFAEDDRAGAASDFLRLQRNYPQDSGADDAMLRAALLYYSESRYTEAVAVCEELLNRYPASPLSTAAHFWAAKALLQGQQQGEVEAHLRAAAESASPGYYSMRASAVLRGDTTILPAAGNVLLESTSEEDRAECQAWLVSWANNGEPYAFDRLPEDLANDPDYLRGKAFASLGLHEEAADAFGFARVRWRDAPLTLFHLAERLRDLGLYRQSIACAEWIIALSPSAALLQSPRYLQRLAFPVYYADLALEQASLNRLDTLLVFAVIRQESRFDPRAGSWAGAMGLMQVIPPTGEWVALQLGIRDFRSEDLFRPALNVRFGTWYLGRQMRDFGGDPLAALAAYNGGPGYARIWLAALADYDPDLFVESIPVVETQTYVKVILEQYAIYRLLYQPGHVSTP